MNVAKTILSQIKALDGWSLGAWGAKDLVALENGLQFKVRKYEYKEIKKVTDVFVEDLVDIIDEMVG